MILRCDLLAGCGKSILPAAMMLALLFSLASGMMVNMAYVRAMQKLEEASTSSPALSFSPDIGRPHVRVIPSVWAWE